MKKINRLYTPTITEKNASDFLKRLNIKSPNDISIENICSSANIDYHFGCFSTIYNHADYTLISIKTDSHKTQQHVEFLHELAHFMLEHVPEKKTLDQEIEANTIVPLLAIPFHMLDYIDFSSPDIIYEVAETFNVPNGLAMMRLEKIKYQVNQSFF